MRNIYSKFGADWKIFRHRNDYTQSQTYNLLVISFLRKYEKSSAESEKIT